MADGLSYFKQVYGEIPDWVNKMHMYSPKMLDYYTDFRGEAFKENALSKKEKDQFIASANAGRLYPRSMIYHTKAAVGNGSTVEELVEHFLVAYLYKGEEALRLALQAIEYAAELTGQNAPRSTLKAEASAAELLKRIISYLPIECQDFTKGVLKSVQENSGHDQLEEKILSAGLISSSKKHLNMVAQYITELDAKGVVRQKKLYLDPFLDLYNSEILSYRISEKPNAVAVMEGLEEAIEVTKDCPYRRTFHSDQGWAYQMKNYRNKLNEHKIFQSMSRKGNCLDNSPMENFFSLLKQEIFHGEIYRSFNELKEAIDQYIYYYNNKRMKKKLNWKSPVEFRKSALCVA